MTLVVIERWVNGIGIFVGVMTLAVAFWGGVWRGIQRPPGRTTGLAKVLRAPLQTLFGILWLGACFVLWQQIPLTFPVPVRIIMLVLGVLLYFPGLALYLWGAKTLGNLFKASSGLGVQLSWQHRLVTYGPFTFVRHPMYLGLMAAAGGGLALYRTWTFVFVLVNFLGLVIRARREEEALAAEFGEAWEAYVRQVPAWLPRLHR